MTKVDEDKIEIMMKASEDWTLVTIKKPREELSVEALGTIESDGEESPLREWIQNLLPNVKVKVTMEIVYDKK